RSVKGLVKGWIGSTGAVKGCEGFQYGFFGKSQSPHIKYRSATGKAWQPVATQFEREVGSE
ncbi:MAG: hypothetical protein J2P36_12375, partial [Ktedonobacteraceae bacterium]|nr:hypothetical protein [Ktedonobacteraceae bacterium]